MNVRECPVGFRNVRIDFVCGARQLERTLQRSGRVGGPLIAVIGRVGQRKARIRARESLVEVDRAPEHLPCRFILRLLSYEQRGLSLLEVLVGLKVARMALRHPAQLGFADFRRQHADDFRTELVLDGEEVGQRTIEPLRPELSSAALLGEKNVQAQALVDALNRSGNEVATLGPTPDLAPGSNLHRRKPYDRKAGGLRQVGEEIRRDAARQQQFLAVLAQRLEGRYRKGRRLRNVDDEVGTRRKSSCLLAGTPPKACRDEQAESGCTRDPTHPVRPSPNRGNSPAWP